MHTHSHSCWAAVWCIHWSERNRFQAKAILSFHCVLTNTDGVSSVPSRVPSMCNAAAGVHHRTSLVRLLLSARALFLLCNNSCLACCITRTCYFHVLLEHHPRSSSAMVNLAIAITTTLLGETANFCLTKLCYQ